MTEFRSVTPDFAVASQLDAADIARAAALGFRIILNNRPDGEAPGQPTSEAIRSATEAAGLTYKTLPFTGPPPPGIVAETAVIFEAAGAGPVLAYCRTGTRSVTAWALAQALSGSRPPDEIIALAAKAGYDLNGVRGVLEKLSPV